MVGEFYCENIYYGKSSQIKKGSVLSNSFSRQGQTFHGSEANDSKERIRQTKKLGNQTNKYTDRMTGKSKDMVILP